MEVDARTEKKKNRFEKESGWWVENSFWEMEMKIMIFTVQKNQHYIIFPLFFLHIVKIIEFRVSFICFGSSSS